MIRNMKKVLLYIVAIVFVFTSCEDFLDSKNYTKQDTSNYPSTLGDMKQMIAGIYTTQNMVTSTASQTSYMVGEMASDDRFGGGGQNDKEVQAMDKLMSNKVNLLSDFWTNRYKGIFRANMALETFDNCEGFTSEEQRNQMLGEIYFMRGYFLHDMAELFGNFPLNVTTVSENLPKAETDDIYGQIAADLKNAIELMASKPYNTLEQGHATKWDAQALMARVFLFYTGFYGKDALPLRDEEGNLAGSVTKDQVIAWLEDCINNSGHSLLPDFRSLWAYSNQWTAEDYPFVEDARWAGDTHANTEKMFSIRYSSMASWDVGIGYANQFALFLSPRDKNGSSGILFPLAQGWGIGTVNPTLWNDWKQQEPDDMRRDATLVNVDDYPGYKYGLDAQVEDGGIWQKKCANIYAYGEDGGLYQFGFLSDFNSNNDIAFNPTDLTLIRFADVLLMHSELKQDVSGINKVRARAGLSPVGGYSLAALKKERRFELCLEGRRWADIRRWGEAPDLLSKQEGVAINNLGIDTQMKAFGPGYRARYEATKGFFPIPESQIDLSAGVLEQNPGWGTTEALYTGW